MSDERMRELEREWKRTGTIEDEVAYLKERVRVGDLTQERLELAALCGHEGAAVTLDEPSLAKALPNDPDEEWFERLGTRSPKAVLLAGLLLTVDALALEANPATEALAAARECLREYLFEFGRDLPVGEVDLVRKFPRIARVTASAEPAVAAVFFAITGVEEERVDMAIEAVEFSRRALQRTPQSRVGPLLRDCIGRWLHQRS